MGIDDEISLETEPLGTIAPLRLIADLPDNFLVINADVLSDLDLLKISDGSHCFRCDFFDRCNQP